jgi:hypothetical protein
MDKKTLLQQTTFGARVAEEEGDKLAEYFVETDQWQRVFRGDDDVVRGPKGSGKSAIYSLLLGREGELFDRNIIVVPAENPRGNTAFSGLVEDPPTSEAEFSNLWTLYLLTLVADKLVEFEIHGEAADYVVTTLQEANLLHGEGEHKSLAQRLRAVLDYVRPRSVEGGVKLHELTGMPALTGKITFAEPSTDEREAGYVSADELLLDANTALEAESLTVWILLDRLDVAFAESRELEGNALRALFHVYVGMLNLASIGTKIFLRADISGVPDEGRSWRTSVRHPEVDARTNPGRLRTHGTEGAHSPP